MHRRQIRLQMRKLKLRNKQKKKYIKSNKQP